MLWRKFHRNNVLWIVGFVLVHTAVIRNIVLPMRPWLSLPNRAMDPLLLSLVKCLQAGSGIRCSTLTLNTSQAAGTKKTIERHDREALQVSKELSSILEFGIAPKGSSTSSRPILKKDCQQNGQGVQRTKNERTVWWLCSIGTGTFFLFGVSDLLRALFLSECQVNRELLHATALGFCSLAPWLHESRQTIEIVCCNVCHFAWSHRIAFSPAFWRLSIIAYCKCCILTNLSIAAAFWSVFQSNTYPMYIYIYIFIYTIYCYCWLCCHCMWWCQSAALSLWAVCESSRTVSAGFSIDRACITVLKFDLFLKRWVRWWAVCSSFAVLLLHSLDFFSLVHI